MLLADDIRDVGARDTHPAQLPADVKDLIPLHPGIAVFAPCLYHEAVAALFGQLTLHVSGVQSGEVFLLRRGLHRGGRNGLCLRLETPFRRHEGLHTGVV